MFGKKSFIAAILLMPALALADLASDWANAPMGIVITNCVYDTYGVSVQFETDLEPPYIVGVYEIWEDGLGRNFPVAEVVTEKKAAYVAGDFTDVTTFVEVMQPSRFNPKMPHRLLSDAERSFYRDMTENAPVLIRSSGAERVNADINWSPDNVMGQLKGMELTSDSLWTGIFYSSSDRPSFKFNGIKAVDNVLTGQLLTVVRQELWNLRSKQEWVIVNCKTNHTHGALDMTNEVVRTSEYGPYDAPLKYTRIKKIETITPTGIIDEYVDGHKMVSVEAQAISVEASADDVSRGVGWRLIYDDNTGETLAQRAYSARTNCSNTVYLPRLFLGISAYNGYRLSTDANGVVICVPDGNSPKTK